ncbi:nuclear transport factor 2 family protein [Brachybacterium sp. GCM10030267]|uniref:nuclear transport factor 2 family protein n=1 Tax=unclassified Brachybacterium TaxID=2623841 RepID=UPI00361FB9BD
METSPNKQTVERYLDGFRRTDHDQILACLTDDIRWTVFGAFVLEGKAAYDAAIEGPGFAGDPELEVVRMVEEHETIMAELRGRVPQPDGSMKRLAMAEVFVMREGLICERRAWVVPLAEGDVW